MLPRRRMFNKAKSRFRFWWGTAVFLSSFLPSLAWAADQSVGLAVDQTIFSLAAFPGEEAVLEINISNLLDKEQLVSLEIGDLLFGDNNRPEMVAEKNELFGMKEWIAPETEKTILAPKQTQKISFHLKIPQDATVGSHYCGIFFRGLPEITGENFQDVLIGAQIGSLVLLNVKGEAAGAGAIKDFQAPLLTEEKTALKVEFENLGNIHYIPFGQIEMKNIFSQKEQKLELEKHFVFPGKKYSFENIWQSGSDWGVYRAKAYFVDGDQAPHFASRWIFGRYSFVWLFLLAAVWFLGRKIWKFGLTRKVSKTAMVFLALGWWGWFSASASAQLLTRKIKNVEAVSGWNRVLVEWEKNEYLSETENLVLVRKENNCPKSVFDGEEIYRGNGSGFEDRTAEKGKKYCYGVGIVGLSGDSSDFKTSGLAEKLNFRESLLTKLASGINLIILLEVIALGSFVFWKRMKNRKTFQ